MFRILRRFAPASHRPRQRVWRSRASDLEVKQELASDTATRPQDCESEWAGTSALIARLAISASMPGRLLSTPAFPSPSTLNSAATPIAALGWGGLAREHSKTMYGGTSTTATTR